MTFLLWLFVMMLGLSFGAGLYEHRISLPRWLDNGHWNGDAARRDDVGRRFWAMVSTAPLTFLTLANLYCGWRASGELQRWWLAAAGIALLERAFTFSYFIPTMVELMRTSDTPEAVAKAQRWRALNLLRHGLVLGAWLAALQTFAMLNSLGSP